MKLPKQAWKMVPAQKAPIDGSEKICFREIPVHVRGGMMHAPLQLSSFLHLIKKKMSPSKVINY